MIRSLLFVPGDSARKFERSIEGSADALILDLEDSVSASEKETARAVTSQALRRPRGRQSLYVRVNALDSGLLLPDLAAVKPAFPDGIVLPKCSSAADVVRLALYLDAFEAAAGAVPGSTRVLAIVTETADSLFNLGGYRNASPRLCGMLWGGEDLAGARAAGVVPVDAVYVDIRNHDGEH